MNRAAFVVNPTKCPDGNTLARQAEAMMAARGWEAPVWLETTPEDPGVGMARTAIEKDADVVFACGGDGTVRACATGLVGSGVPLAVLPLGTGNLLARNLGLPDDLESAILVGLDGVDRFLDVGRVGDERFAVMAGMGFDAAMMRDAPEKLKDHLGWAGYVVSAVKHLRDPSFGMVLSVDDEAPRRLKAATVVIGNVGRLQGGIPLLADASPYDGALDVVVVAPRTVTGWLRIGWSIVTRRSRDDGRLLRARGRRITVRADRAQPRQLDGDLIGAATELTVDIQPAALIVRVPKEATS